MAFTVAIQVDLHSAFGRGVNDGIVEYALRHADWACRFPGPYSTQPVDVDVSGVDGIIARVRSAEEAEQLQRVTPWVVNVSSRMIEPVSLAQVLLDDVGIGRLAAQAFRDRGIDRFAYAHAATTGFSARRLEGFRRELSLDEAREIDVAVVDFSTTAADLRELVRGSDLKRPASRPLGLFCSNDLLARAMVHRCAEAGLAVPDEVAILGVDNEPQICALTHPPLSSIQPAFERVGYEAAALLHRLMAGEPAPDAPALIPPIGVVARRSTDIIAVDDELVRQALLLIRQHAIENPSVETIADMMQLSRRTLELRFRKALGRSPRKEIVRVQVERARVLLGTTRLPMGDVARRCGFSSAVRFSMVFARTAGEPPSTYRARFQQR